MDPIDRVSRAMQLLRRRLSNPSRETKAGSVSVAAEPASAGPQSEAGMRETVVARLQSINPDESGYAERATEAFVEGVLLGEFGQSMTNDPQFRQVIRGVARDLRAEPQTATELDDLFRSMRPK